MPFCVLFHSFFAYIYGMNLIFALVFLVCTCLLLFTNPDGFLSATLDGMGKAGALCVSLLSTYALWMGLMQVWEDCGLAKGISKLLKPLVKRVLKTDDEEALSAATMNISVNLLGISGAATPYGIKAAKLLDKTDNAEYSSAMLFVLNATSLQLLPSSLVAVRVAMHSNSPADILLPTFLSTLFSTAIGVALTALCIRSKKERRAFQARRKARAVQ